MTEAPDWYANLSHDEADQLYLDLERRRWDAADALAAIISEQAGLLNLMKANNWSKPEEVPDGRQ